MRSVLVVLALWACAAPAHPRAAVDASLGRELDDYLTRLAGFGYSGAMLVVHRGQVVLNKGYGIADRRTGALNTPETIFDLGSLTKQFTAAAILRLELDGKLQLADPISRHLPGVPADKAAITVRQLLTHTSGMPSFRGGRIREVDREHAIARILAAPLRFPPGSKTEYSNGGYSLLAAIVETASGRPYRAYLREALFAPAGLRSTGFWGAEAAPGAMAHAYDDVSEVGDPRAWSATTWDGVGDSGVTSSALDLYRWFTALREDRVLTRAARLAMWPPAKRGAASDDYGAGEYGYGWWIETTTHGTRIQHGGDSIGFGSQLTWYPDADLLVIGLCNIRHDLFPTIIQAARVVPEIVFGAAHPQPPAIAPADPAAMAALAGTYVLPTGGRLIVRSADGQLQIGAEGQDAAVLLIPASADTRARREALTARAATIFGGAVAGDFSAMAAALPPGDDIGFWREGWPDEMKQLAGPRGELRGIEALGTVPAGQPGYFDTILRFDFAGGSAPYEVRWQGDVFTGSSTESPALAAVLPLQAAPGGGFVTWNIVFWDRPDEPLFVRRTGDTLVLERTGQRVVARRG